MDSQNSGISVLHLPGAKREESDCASLERRDQICALWAVSLLLGQRVWALVQNHLSTEQGLLPQPQGRL